MLGALRRAPHKNATLSQRLERHDQVRHGPSLLESKDGFARNYRMPETANAPEREEEAR
jgi:hypothetical protein